MELSERYIQKLEHEGYASVYEMFEDARASHASQTRVTDTTLVVIEGSIKILMGEDMRTLFTGDVCVIPAHVPYSYSVGPVGSKYIVGER
ncbi:MAG TPA: hypothetical protein VFV22_02950 [Candidatus Paceibacterota bacterium]|nr:hypothetical protein [Candidatus Paceibacterota bacterium]